MDGGWIKIHSKILKWEWFDDPGMVAMWVYILLSANWEDRKWHGITIPRGSFITSRAKLAESVGLTVQKVRTCLEKLKSTSEITIESTNKYTIITVCKYDDYQVNEKKVQPAEQPAEQQTNNHQITTTADIKDNIYNINTNAHTREDDWRFVSSVRKSLLGFDKNRIAEYKREIFQKEVAALAEIVGMPEKEQEGFVSWWTEHSLGSEKIKAEFEVAFDMESRMRNWMSRVKPAKKSEPKSRMDSLESDMNFIHDFFNEQQSTTPDDQ